MASGAVVARAAAGAWAEVFQPWATTAAAAAASTASLAPCKRNVMPHLLGKSRNQRRHSLAQFRDQHDGEEMKGRGGERRLGGWPLAGLHTAGGIFPSGG